MKKKKSKLRQTLDDGRLVQFNQEEIRRLFKKQKEEGMATSVTIDQAKAQAPLNP